MTRAYGVDISKHNFSADGKRKVNFTILNPQIFFCGVRACISWGYTDPWFAYSRANLTEPLLAYHVTYPGEDANRQMDHFLRTVNPGEHDRLVLDLELDHGYGKARITQAVNACVERLKAETGRYPVIYSRASWVDAFLEVADLPVVDWWLANYLTHRPAPLFTPEHAGPPLLPKGVSTWLIHQTGERGNGKAHGVASYYVDQNRWNGTAESVLAYFGLAEDTPEPEPEPEETLFNARVIDIAPDRLRVRAAPGSDKILRHLKSGEEVSVFEQVPVWDRIGRGEWAMDSYLQRVVDEGDDRNLLPVPLWNQRDPRWEWLKMGQSGITLGQQGCLATVTAACLSLLLGRDVTPLEYGQLLNAKTGYLPPTNRMYWQMPKILYGTPLVTWKGFNSGEGWESTVQGLLDQGLPALGRVDMLPGAGYLQHWIAFLGRTGSTWWILDPWYGIVAALAARYDKVYHVAAYGKP